MIIKDENAYRLLTDTHLKQSWPIEGIMTADFRLKPKKEQVEGDYAIIIRPFDESTSRTVEVTYLMAYQHTDTHLRRGNSWDC